MICVALGLALSSCAQEGTVVRKEFRPLPFPDSLGVLGIFRFEIQDREGHIHRQMVTPAVFARYRVGDYFNDREVPVFRAEPTARPAPWLNPGLERRPLDNYGTPYR